MIGYTMFGSNDVQAAASFYDQLFSEIGVKRLWELPTMVGWGKDSESAFFAVTTPHDKATATAGNGTMIAIQCPDSDIVDKIHSKGLGLGAANEGDPGLRMGSYYCAYLRDLDGNKLNFYCVKE